MTTTEILSELRSQYNCFDELEEPVYRALSEAIKAVSAQPEIIRCKDCKHHGTNGYRLNCVVFCCTMPDDGFCSCGERREDG